jgi:hypothetical protein
MSLMIMWFWMTVSCYTIVQKITYVEYAQLRMEEDLASLTTVTDECGVSHTSLSRWINKLPIYRHITKTDQVRFSLICGRKSQLEDIGPALLAFVEVLDNFEYFPRSSLEVDVPPVVNVPMGEDATNLISDMEVGSDDDAGALVGVV